MYSRTFSVGMLWWKQNRNTITTSSNEYNTGIFSLLETQKHSGKVGIWSICTSRKIGRRPNIYLCTQKIYTASITYCILDNTGCKLDNNIRRLCPLMLPTLDFSRYWKFLFSFFFLTSYICMLDVFLYWLNLNLHIEVISMNDEEK